MDIRFCDICNESIAQVHFDEGRASLRDGHVCVASSGAQPRGAGRPGSGRATRGSGAEWMAAAAIVIATGLAWVALDRTERSAAELGRELTAERARIAVALGAFSGGLGDMTTSQEDQRAQLAGQLDALRAESEGGRVRAEELAAQWQVHLASLAESVADLGTDERSGDTDRLARVETALAELRVDVELLGGALIETLDRLSEAAPAGAEAAPDQPSPSGAPDWSSAVANLSDADAMVRWDAVDQIARSGDAAAAEPLLPLLGDPDLVVRMSVARALAELGNPIATPALIDALEDPEPPVREAAVVALRQLTGRSFRFDPVASETDRARKVEAWRRWWERSGSEGADAP